MRLESLATNAALVAAVVAVLLALAPGPVYGRGILDLFTAFSLLLDWAPRVAVAAGALGLVALAMAAYRRRWPAAGGAAVAALLGASVWISVDNYESRVAGNPLHDITTDLQSPPRFAAIAPRSYEIGAADAVAAYPHPDWRRRHAEIYPDIQSLIVPNSLSQAASSARLAAEQMGWNIVGDASGDELTRIEATDETAWFGFTDDIVVELRREANGGTRLDIRSVSRIGIGDAGKNATRVRDFLGRLAP